MKGELEKEACSQQLVVEPSIDALKEKQQRQAVYTMLCPQVSLYMSVPLEGDMHTENGSSLLFIAFRNISSDLSPR